MTATAHDMGVAAPATRDRADASGRYDAIDVGRGLAVLAMVGAHLAGTEGGVNALELSATGLLKVVEGTLAALFCVVAGISWAIQAERVGVTPQFRRYFAGRALALGAFGLAFHVLFWRTEILVPFAMMMALSLLVLGRSPRATAGVLVAFIATSPLVILLLGSHAGGDWGEDGLHAADRAFGWATLRYLFLDGNYPLFSWMAFPLIGILFWQTSRGVHVRVRTWAIAAAGLAVGLHLVALVTGSPLGQAYAAERHLTGGWTPTSASFLVTMGSGAIAIVAALLWWQGTAPMSRVIRPLVLFGRASLTHYLLHIVVAYSVLRLWYPDEDWSVTVGLWAAAAYLAVGVPLTMLWFRDHTHGPFETLWARASRRPAPGARAAPASGPYPVEVRRENGTAGLFASRSLASGEVVLPIEGRSVAGPSRYSIQLGTAMHMAPSSEGASPWMWLNHGCAPNVAVDTGRRLLVARRKIAPGEELRFDYHTTEWAMAEPFPCGCGAPGCIGMVQGFARLPASRQQALLGTVAPHILALHAGVAAGAHPDFAGVERGARAGEGARG